MTLRCAILLACGLILACESNTGPEDGAWSLDSLLQQSQLSSDYVKTVLMQDGTLYSWGDGRSGALGQGNEESLSYPTKIPGLEGVIAYAQNAGMAFALTEDGSLYQWGHYIFSSIYPHPTTRPVRAGRVEGAVSIFAWAWMVYILDDRGGLWRVEPSHVHPSKTPAAQPLPQPKRVARVSGTIGLYEDGTLFSLQNWGPEDGGAIEGIHGATDLYHSYESAMVLKADGTVWSWGVSPCARWGMGSIRRV